MSDPSIFTISGDNALKLNQPKSLSFVAAGEPLLSFHDDGRVIVSDKLTPDEVGKKVLAVLLEQWPMLVENAREAGRNEVRERFADFGCEIKGGQLYSYGMQVRYPEG